MGEESHDGANAPAGVPGPHGKISKEGVMRFVAWSRRTFRDRPAGPAAMAAE